MNSVADGVLKREQNDISLTESSSNMVYKNLIILQYIDMSYVEPEWEEME